MNSLSQVVWYEGMHLGPHEFQTQARSFEDSLHFVTSTLWLESYGFTGYALDADALRNGTVGLIHAAGILPDGMPFLMPQSDPIPTARSVLDSFSPTQDSLMVSLAIAERKPAGRNCGVEETEETRYTPEVRSFNDETSGSDARFIQIRRKNTRVLLENEASEGLVTLPLARIKRDGSGHFIYDPHFVPPCLKTSASERLMVILRRLIEILEAKSATLSEPPTSGTSLEFSPRDIAKFWLAHAVNSALAALQHLWVSKRGHPEELFLEMSRLGGSLCTFALDSHPRSLPSYDHQNLENCFEALDQHIRQHLETVIPTNCIAIPLKRVADWFYEGEVIDTRCLGRARWIFGIQAEAGEAELIVKTPQLVKICSAKFVGELVRRAIGGLPLTHLPMPPGAIAAKVESQYFGISKEGPFWDNIVQTNRVGIYVPGDLPNPELELLVVLDR